MLRFKHLPIAATLLVGVVFVFSCTKKVAEAVSTSPDDPDMIERALEPIEIVDGDPFGESDSIIMAPKVYRATAKQDYDILHTSLDLRFDWSKQHVIGVADLSIKPYFKAINKVMLDAVGFEYKSVKVNNADAKYTFDNRTITIDLGKTYTRDQKFTISIQYIAKPNENPEGGSEAITSDKGLFFIDPMDTDPEMPTQIWTQGETENNSKWFPTFDKPNERFTQEIKLTVDDKYLTLSNGMRVSTRKNADGTRTDIWKQDKPHAPYLTMIAVGLFHEEMDQWEGKPLHYIVEKGWAKHAKKIYNHTPEMLTFFSNKLNYKYPWDKYAQIAVREYVSGAMENTSAVIFGEFVQKTDREMIDNDNDRIVAHEMMHHWFGDLVTCEDWSNLTLNEGFANYAEYLWMEHKYGIDRADFHRLNEMNGYLSGTDFRSAHPLIHYYYEDKENMFDAHSYNKGGMVLHMLRNYVGDDAFFASLNKYLVDNAYTAVEVDELRMAFEDTTGEDMQWFFDQWFLGNGHPHAKINYEYMPTSKSLQIVVDQSGTPMQYHRPFILPTEVAIYYADGSVEYRPAQVTRMVDTILLTHLKDEPTTYVWDGKNVLLGIFEDQKPQSMLMTQFQRSERLFDKLFALTDLASMAENDPSIMKDASKLALNDRYTLIRLLGISALPDDMSSDPGILERLEKIALTDPSSENRNAALQRLTSVEGYDIETTCTLVAESEQAYPVLATALSVLGSDENKARKYVERYRNESSDYLASTLVSIMPDQDSITMKYADQKARTIPLNYIVDYYSAYESFLGSKSPANISHSVENLSKIAAEPKGNMYRKYMAMYTMYNLKNNLASRTTEGGISDIIQNLKTQISKIVAEETNAMLKSRYAEMQLE
jgi:aminopeptidase N